MAAEVLTKLTVVLEGAGTAWEGRPSQSPATNPQGRLWYPQVSPESCHPCPAGLVPSLVTLVPRQPQGFFRGQKLRNSPTFPATQHHVVVLADCFIFTAQAVCFHVPIEPLRIVEGALTVLPQTQEVVRDVRNDVAAVEVQDAGAEVSLALQGLQPPLFQLGVVAVKVDMADEISRIVQRTKATFLP